MVRGLPCRAVSATLAQTPAPSFNGTLTAVAGVDVRGAAPGIPPSTATRVCAVHGTDKGDPDVTRIGALAADV